MGSEKAEFIAQLKSRTKKFAVEIIHFCNSLTTAKVSSVITYQLVKSATSVGANYRAACRARSQNEFFSKICIVVEEIDECEYWLEIIKDTKLTSNDDTLQKLLLEANELTKIMATAKNSTITSIKAR
jgi:four helix bundle protein